MAMHGESKVAADRSGDCLAPMAQPVRGGGPADAGSSMAGNGRPPILP
jgi:hypothetical protein